MRHICINFTVSRGNGVFLGSEEPSLKLSLSTKLQRTNFSLISYSLGIQNRRLRSCAIDIMATSSIVSDNEA